MNKNIKAALLSALVFPGLGQIYKGCRLKGCIIILVANILLLAALALAARGIYLFSLSGGFSATPDLVKTADRVIRETPGLVSLLTVFLCLWLYGVLDALLYRRKDRSS